MANIMTQRGSMDNVVTYVHYCDTVDDMENIDPEYITLGSVCIVVKGESSNLEIYMATSEKEWVDLNGKTPPLDVPGNDDLHFS